ncbi:TonB-dependent receptor [bacterium SCSIO 12696]|nr:TonB-dependent receptor [bacterium SCSIO 12696]
MGIKGNRQQVNLGPWCTAPLLVALCGSPAADINDSLPLTLPEQPLAETLIELGRQSKVSIIFSHQTVEALRSESLNGELPLLEALEVALADKPLQYRVISPKAIAIVETSAASENSSSLAVEDHIEEMVVHGTPITGSRLRRSEAQAFAPIEILTATELSLNGAPSLSEQLKFVPIVSGNSTSTAVSNGGDGTATVTLRGLPASNTLVLINGQRVASNGFGGDAVDLNTIPSAAIERIEILKDGASAVYGSDAIAGVVNVILKRKFEGVQLETFYGQSGASDNETVTTNIVWGEHGDWGSFTLAASYFDQAGFNSRDRDFSRSADGRSRGGIDKRSTATPNARFDVNDTTLIISENAEGSSPDDFRTATDEDLFDFSDFTSSLTPSERGSIYINSEYQVSSTLTFDLAASYTRTESTISFAPTPIFTAFELVPVVIAADSAFNPFGVEVNDLRRRMLELGARDQTNKNQATRLTFGINGHNADWRWSLHYNWSQTRAREQVTGLVNLANLQQGVGPASECVDGCVNIDLFGAQGSLNQQQVDFIRADVDAIGNTQLRNLTFDLSRDLWSLPAGDLGLALGFEVRHESISTTPDPLARSGLLAGGINFADSLGSRNVGEAYMEWLIPLLAGSNGGSRLDLNVALRHSEYSDFGSSTNPKLALSYQPSRHWRLRASYSEGFRAPSLIELFKGTSQDFPILLDPCAEPDNVGALPGCQQQSDPNRNQFLTLLGGNIELSPESSRNKSLGIIWEPQTAADLSLTLDFFDISQNDIIDANAQFFVTANAESGLFADRVIRDNDGEISRIISTQANLGIRRISGLDLNSHWHYYWDWIGMVSSNFSATYLREYLSQVSPLAALEDLAGTFEDAAADGNGSLPKWKVHVNFYLQRSQWEAAYSINFVDSLNEEIPRNGGIREASSWTTHDLQYAYLYRDNAKFTIGVDNVLDTPPPFLASAFNDNFDSRNYDGIGRFWYARLTYDF